MIKRFGKHFPIQSSKRLFIVRTLSNLFRSQKQLLKRHVNLYHDPEYVPPAPKEKTHICPTCNRQFRHKGNLIRHMAFHDPDSNLREHAMALKVGRQKRIQVIDGQQVEVYSGIDDDEEYEGESDYEEYIDGELDNDSCSGQIMSPKQEKGEGIVAIGDDGQRYMVVEVINMEDDDQDELDEENGGMEIEELILPDGEHFFFICVSFDARTFAYYSDNFLIADLEPEPIDEAPAARKISGKAAAGKDMEDYFGFEVSQLLALKHLYQKLCLKKSSVGRGRANR